jgi:transcription initiation factor TFIIIB Brf1 subunit/transcription initiation factor TFIIB
MSDDLNVSKAVQAIERHLAELDRLHERGGLDRSVRQEAAATLRAAGRVLGVGLL